MRPQRLFKGLNDILTFFFADRTVLNHSFLNGPHFSTKRAYFMLIMLKYMRYFDEKEKCLFIDLLLYLFLYLC